MRLTNKESYADETAAAVLAVTQAWGSRVAAGPDAVDWRGFERALFNALVPNIIETYTDSALQLADEAGFEIDRRDIANEAERWAASYAATLAADFAAHTRERVTAIKEREDNEAAAVVAYLLLLGAMDWTGYASTDAEDEPVLSVRGQVVTWPRDTSGALIESAEQTSGAHRARLVGVTETSRASSYGMQAGAGQIEGAYGVKLVAYWAHHDHRPPGHCGASVDPCQICTPLEGRPVEEIGFWPGDAHAGCDCDAEWRVVGGVSSN